MIYSVGGAADAVFGYDGMESGSTELLSGPDTPQAGVIPTPLRESADLGKEARRDRLGDAYSLAAARIC